MASRASVPAPEQEVTSARVADIAVVARWTLLALTIAGVLALQPLWVPLLLAAWLAIVVRPLHQKMVHKFGTGRAAGVITVILFVVAVTPVVILTLSVMSAAVDLVQKLQKSGGFREAFQALLATEPSLALDRFDVRRAAGMLQRHGSGALNMVTTLFGAATAIVIGLVVFLFGFYTFLVDGRRLYGWLLEHAPLPRRYTARLADAFVETGKGLLISVALTAAVQGVVATLGYVIIGVPQALVLGLVTVFAALIPSVGTGLVWAPLALGLFLSDRTAAGIAMLGLGAFTSIIDNFLRPWLSRYGHLQLPMFLVFIAMLGGITAFGAWGLLIGPLFVRLALEALRIWRDERSPTVDLQL